MVGHPGTVVPALAPQPSPPPAVASAGASVALPIRRGGGVCMRAMLSGGAMRHLALIVSVCFCCERLSLYRLHAISVVTMVCDRPAH